MTCGMCIHKNVCKHKEHYDLFIREIEEMKKEYDLPKIETEIFCKSFKEEEF